MPTSKYCDHKSSLIRSCFTSWAFLDPGTIFLRLSPIKSPIDILNSSAFLKSPEALSSITLSTIDFAKVTPHALTTCKSQGANNLIFVLKFLLFISFSISSIEIIFLPSTPFT